MHAGRLIAIPRRRGALAAAVALAASLALAASAAAALKLPAERTSPTGNFFTLEAYRAPRASHPDAEFQMKVCTSRHTPSYTMIEPGLFTLLLTNGRSVTESVGVATHPAITPQPMKPLQCVSGWLGFVVPKGATVSKLEYDYNGRISWAVG